MLVVSSAIRIHVYYASSVKVCSKIALQCHLYTVGVMADDKTTSVKVSETVWKELHRRKQLGDSFDDVLRRALDLDSDGELPEDVERYLAGLDERDDRRAAVRACYEFVERVGTCAPQDFKEQVQPEHPAGRESANSWWRVVGPLVDDCPRIKRPKEKRYEFDG